MALCVSLCFIFWTLKGIFEVIKVVSETGIG